MSSALAAAAAEKKSSRILRRDERKAEEMSYRVRGAGINKVVAKEVTKNPTRVIPDQPGFHGLTKLEYKRDTRDIDKRSALMNMNETDSEDEIESSVPITVRPPCNPESTAYKKKARFMKWESNPSLAQQDVAAAAAAVRTLKTEFDRIRSEKAKWLDACEVGRGMLCASLNTNKEYIVKLTTDMRHLYNIALLECGPGSRKRRSQSMRDCVEELQDRHAQLIEKFQEYELLATEMVEAAAKADSNIKRGKDPTSSSIPTAHVTIEETDLLNYEWDRDIFIPMADKHDRKGSNALNSANTSAEMNTQNPSASSEDPDGVPTLAMPPVGVDRNAAATAVDDSKTSGAGDNEEDRLAALIEKQRKLAATVEMPRGSSLQAVEGAAGAANAQVVTVNESGAGTIYKTDADEASIRSTTRKSTRVENAEKKDTVVKSDIHLVTDSAAVPSGQGLSLHGLLKEVEEAISICRANLGDIGAFLQDDSHSLALPTASVAGALISPRTTRAPHALDENIREIGPGDASEQSVRAVCEIGAALVPSSTTTGKRALAQHESLKTDFDWMRHLESTVNGIDSVRKRRRGSSTIPLSTFAYAHTPRGVPLIISPISQYEDKYVASVFGGPPGYNVLSGEISDAAKYALPQACKNIPSDIRGAENRAMRHCLLQSASASSEGKIRRLKHILEDYTKQSVECEVALSSAERIYVHTLLEDTIEKKRIRRELQTLGISAQPNFYDNDTPLSPLAETSGWNSNGAVSESHFRGPWGRGKGKKAQVNAERAQELARQKELQAEAVRQAALYRPGHTLPSSLSSSNLSMSGRDSADITIESNGTDPLAADNGFTIGAENGLDEEPPKKRGKKSRR